MKLTQQTLTLLLLCCALCACSSSNVDSAKLTDTAAKLAAPQAAGLDSTSLPELPAPSTLATGSTPSRQLSVAGDSVFIAGEDYSESLPNQNTSTFNGSVFLDGGSNGGWIATRDFADFGYATFEFDITGLDPTPRVRADWVFGPYDDLVYVALANFELDRWNWFELKGRSSAELPELAPFTDGQGRVMLLVLYGGQEYAQLAGVSIGSEWQSSNVIGFGVFDETQSTDIALISLGGLPAFAYTDEDSSTGDQLVLFTRATDIDGTSWTEPIDLLGPREFGGDIALLEVNGRPALAYQVREVNIDEDIIGSLYYMRAEDALGTNWGEPVQVADNQGNHHGQQPFLAIINGNPAISYKNETPDGFSDGLQYVRALDEDGAVWDEPVEVAPPISFGYGLYHAPLAEIDGNPAIAYQFSDPKEIGYTRATDVNGAEWGDNFTIPANSPAGYHLFLHDHNGMPALVYDADDSGETNWLIGTSADGSSWAGSVVIYASGEGDPGSQPLGYALIDGLPAVLVDQWAISRNVLCRADDAEGSSWGLPEHVTYNLDFSSLSKMVQIGSGVGFVSVTGTQLVYNSLQ